jgi:oxygen-independent coproporphyrinogen-3 oxidase
MERDGLVRVAAETIEVQPAGKLLIRNVCMAFDKYLGSRQSVRYSKAI